MVANLLSPFRQSKVNLFHINNMVINPVDIDGALPSFIHHMNICKRQQCFFFAIKTPRTSLRMSKFMLNAGPTEDSCITLILRIKRCCGLLCSSSDARFHLNVSQCHKGDGIPGGDLDTAQFISKVGIIQLNIIHSEILRYREIFAFNDPIAD